ADRTVERAAAGRSWPSPGSLRPDPLGRGVLLDIVVVEVIAQIRSRSVSVFSISLTHCSSKTTITPEPPLRTAHSTSDWIFRFVTRSIVPVPAPRPVPTAAEARKQGAGRSTHQGATDGSDHGSDAGLIRR